MKFSIQLSAYYPDKSYGGDRLYADMFAQAVLGDRLGNDGGCNPRLNRLIDAALPNSKLVILPELKHSILIEAPELVAAHLGDFLDATTVP